MWLPLQVTAATSTVVSLIFGDGVTAQIRSTRYVVETNLSKCAYGAILDAESNAVKCVALYIGRFSTLH